MSAALETSGNVTHIESLPDTPIYRRMLQGHVTRKSHAAKMVHVSADGILWHRVALCCGETVPPRVNTWESLT